ncbi:tetratricopeptide repeat protein [Photobacterium leiognathi]|uniref:tetratricopeptide repeat protein n=1 Tax=Photobacterium leiognathi TaxID=553611 RepID=UPI0029814AF8|nr:hypothetical protein [Photobacterium leiognathi]
MNNEVGINLDWLQIAVDFISNNIGWLTFIVFIVVFRDALSDLFKRLTGLNISNGESKLGLNAVPPMKSESMEPQQDSPVSEPKAQELEPVVSENEAKSWFAAVNEALEEGDIEKSRKVFKAYELEATDQSKLYSDKSLYLYLMFHKANDRSAIALLEKHLDESPNEELRYNALTWLSYCLNDSKQFSKDIELWRNESSRFQSQEIDTKVAKDLAFAYRANGDLDEAKNILINKLKTLQQSKHKALIFSALALVEEEQGNKAMGAYCRDKSVENDPENLDEVFSSAYNASEAGIDELAISNYVLLTGVNPKNSTAWNNLGVQAKESELNTKAIENYGKAIELEDTLAIANQGYALLHAGFVDEAERMASKALECKEIHENVYSLLSRISSVRKEENKKWLEIQSKAFKKQVKFRKYTDKYYLGDPSEFSGTWSIGSEEKSIVTGKDKVSISWESQVGLSTKTKFTITGLITGASFRGQYKSEAVEQAKTSLLGGLSNFNLDCLGYVHGESLYVFSLKKDSERNIEFKKSNA